MKFLCVRCGAPMFVSPSAKYIHPCQCIVRELNNPQAAAMAGLLGEASTALRLDTTRKSQSDLQFVCADKIDAALKLVAP